MELGTGNQSKRKRPGCDGSGVEVSHHLSGKRDPPKNTCQPGSCAGRSPEYRFKPVVVENARSSLGVDLDDIVYFGAANGRHILNDTAYLYRDRPGTKVSSGGHGEPINDYRAGRIVIGDNIDIFHETTGWSRNAELMLLKDSGDKVNQLVASETSQQVKQ